jgi:hypothetical protein
MDNLVYRLRDAVTIAQSSGKANVDTLKIEDAGQAADRIETLTSHNAQMLEALRSIANSQDGQTNEALRIVAKNVISMVS